MEYLPSIILFLVTSICGILAVIIQKKLDNSIKLFLSFSGAFLLSTCVIHLLPEIFGHKDLNVGPFILLGFFLQIIIEYISQGVEHGHIHPPHETVKFPLFIYLGLCFHAFTEGLPLADVNFNNMMSSPLYWGILLHKLPIVIVLATLFSTYKIKTYTSVFSLIIFSLLAPLGGYTGKMISDFSDSDIVPYFLAISTGIFLHISTVILFETSHNHRFNFIKFFFILIGGLLAVFLF